MRQASLLAEPRNYVPEVADVPTMEWTEFLEDLEWQQGEHVTVAAPTGWGKTTLGLDLLQKRRYVAILATKPRDSTLANLHGYKVMRSWNPVPQMYPRVIFWPTTDPTKIREQRAEFAAMLQSVYKNGGWAIYIDELDYICNFLQLKPLVELLWRQGRSLDISVVGGTQRPYHVPLLAYDQASHLFVGRDNDDRNIVRYRSIGGGSRDYRRQVEAAINSLQKLGDTWGEFLYLSTRQEGMVKTHVAR